jgi:hypothetical protein
MGGIRNKQPNLLRFFNTGIGLRHYQLLLTLLEFTVLYSLRQ